MAPSALKMGAAALVYSTVVVGTQVYQISEQYTPSTFFSKFSFLDTADSNSGFVQWVSESVASSSNLISSTSDGVHIGVDNTSSGSDISTGRPSVYLISESTYNAGDLIIAKFNHFPKPTCGVWPAFWMTNQDNWPDYGEFDIYEEWNEATDNVVSFHTGPSATVGTCTVDTSLFTSSNAVTYTNCDNDVTSSSGCGATESNGQWGSSTGGVYALEWTEDSVSVWSWATETADIASGTPDPSTWGLPHFSVATPNCDVTSVFKDMNIIFDIDFCGNPVGTQFWESSGCAASTGVSTCNDYIQNNPSVLDEVYWDIAYIDVYQLGTATSSSSSSSSSSSTSTASSSSSISSSSATTTSILSSATTSTTSSSASFSSSSSLSSSSSTSTSSNSISSASSTSVASSTTPFFNSTVPTSGSYTGPTPSNSAIVVSPTPPYSNGTISSGSGSDSASASGSGSSPQQWTTSTVYSTNTYTITSCAATVTNCPARIGQVTTEVIAVYTTVCPVAESESERVAALTTSPSVPLITSTVYTTTTYTTGGSVTTEIIPLYTTVCPVTATEESSSPTGTSSGTGSGSGSENGQGSGSESGSDSTVLTTLYKTVVATTTKHVEAKGSSTETESCEETETVFVTLTSGASKVPTTLASGATKVPTTLASGAIKVPATNATASYIWGNSTVSAASSTFSAASPAGTSSGTGSGSSSSESSSSASSDSKIATSGAVRTGASLLLAAVGALAVLAL